VREGSGELRRHVRVKREKKQDAAAPDGSVEVMIGQGWHSVKSNAVREEQTVLWNFHTRSILNSFSHQLRPRRRLAIIVYIIHSI
jgi:hypothetical protein